ncbi:ABC transporter ATP-binding protein [Gordonia paraffinivorans]|uniref:ABC transporter ATP-binding protein n=1 Tax=Gordonia paraffinivorans TaxID=175628 RepID=UPI00215B6C7F|nr:ABC transporter ATP-binding protein [Gordonia paraffinivorans]
MRVNGLALEGLSARRRAALVAYVPQSTGTTFPFTTLDMAVMGRTPHLPVTRSPSRRDRLHALDVLSELGLAHLADQSFASLSGGERSLAMIARALVQEAEILVLDEPTAALDLGNSVRVLRLVRELSARGRTVLMTTHQPDHALHVAHRAVLLADGRVEVDGDPRTVLTGEVLSRVYQTSVAVASTTVPGRSATVSSFLPLDLLPDLDPNEGTDSSQTELRQQEGRSE